MRFDAATVRAGAPLRWSHAKENNKPRARALSRSLTARLSGFFSLVTVRSELPTAVRFSQLGVLFNEARFDQVGVSRARARFSVSCSRVATQLLVDAHSAADGSGAPRDPTTTIATTTTAQSTSGGAEANLAFAPGVSVRCASSFSTFVLTHRQRTFEFAFDAPLTPFELECLHVVLQLGTAPNGVCVCMYLFARLDAHRFCQRLRFAGASSSGNWR